MPNLGAFPVGSSLHEGPFSGPVYKGAVLCWGPKRGPNLENTHVLSCPYYRYLAVFLLCGCCHL